MRLALPLCLALLAACATSGGVQPHWSAAGQAQYIDAAQLSRQQQYARAMALLEGAPTAEQMEVAVALFRLAATPQVDAQYVYSPPVGAESAGRVIRVPTGPGHPGHASAQYQLGKAYLEGRGTTEDTKRARRWLEKAAAQGSTPAAALLASLQ